VFIAPLWYRVFTSKQVPKYSAKVRIRFAPNVIAGIRRTALFGLRAENRRRDHVTRLGACIVVEYSYGAFRVWQGL